MRIRRTFTERAFARVPWIWVAVCLACSMSWRVVAQPAGVDAANANRVLVLPGNGSFRRVAMENCHRPQGPHCRGLDAHRPTDGGRCRLVREINASLTLRTQVNPAAFLLESKVRPEAGQGFLMSVGSVLAVRQWCHVAVVVGPTQARVYFNGTLAASRNAIPRTAGPVPRSGRVRIGKSVDPVSVLDQTLGAEGRFDEVRIWEAERSEPEIRASMTRRATRAEPGLVALWNFDAGNSGLGRPEERFVQGAAVVESPTPFSPEPVLGAAAVHFDGVAAYVDLPARGILGPFRIDDRILGQLRRPDLLPRCFSYGGVFRDAAIGRRRPWTERDLVFFINNERKT